MTKCQAFENACIPVSVIFSATQLCQSLTLQKSALKSPLKTDTMQCLMGLLAIISEPSHMFTHYQPLLRMKPV